MAACYAGGKRKPYVVGLADGEEPEPVKWPWNYFYTTARSKLNLSEEEFLDMTPRLLIGMIQEYSDMQIINARIIAHVFNGGKLATSKEQEAEAQSMAFYHTL